MILVLHQQALLYEIDELVEIIDEQVVSDDYAHLEDELDELQIYLHILEAMDEVDDDELDIEYVHYEVVIQYINEIDDEMCFRMYLAIWYLDEVVDELLKNDVIYFGWADVVQYDEIDENEYQ